MRFKWNCMCTLASVVLYVRVLCAQMKFEFTLRTCTVRGLCGKYICIQSIQSDEKKQDVRQSLLHSASFVLMHNSCFQTSRQHV